MNMPTVSIFNGRIARSADRGARGKQSSRNAPHVSHGLDILE